MSESRELTPILAKPLTAIPMAIQDAGPAAQFAWHEFFGAMIRNRHTRLAYLGAVRQFLAWASLHSIPLPQIQPGMVGHYFDQHPGSIPTKKLHLAALRHFFDALVQRHVLILNPAATVRGERYQVIEGKTPEITGPQIRVLLESIETRSVIGLRDKAILSTLIYTVARAGAVAHLRIGDLLWDGTQYSLRFCEKGGKQRLIPVRHDLQLALLAYLERFDGMSQPKDAPLFRSIAGRTGQLTNKSIRNVDVCRMMKRRLKVAGLPGHLSPHSFRVATITNLRQQRVPLEDVQNLAGHADPRTTRLYDRQKQEITRNLVERISI